VQIGAVPDQKAEDIQLVGSVGGKRCNQAGKPGVIGVVDV
jgi:hypothetical protein